MKNKNYITPPAHNNFKALKLWDEPTNFSDLSIAYIEPGGGGPMELHTHPYDHLFIVVEGEVTILEDGKEFVLREEEAYRVKGSVPHSVRNQTQERVTMLGMTLLS